MNAPRPLPRRTVLAAGASLAWPAVAGADSLQALVIGNTAYEQAPLPNAVKDARAVGQALRERGFAVRQVEDADGAALQRAVQQLAAQARDAVVFLYYAGHGVQLGQRNFAVPLDYDVASEARLQATSAEVDAWIDALAAAGARLVVVVLDCCRENPFGSDRDFVGLAPRDAPPGTVIAFATEAGNTAVDGDEREGRGLYCRHLLRELQRGPSPLDDTFKRLRYAVWRASRGRQIPSWANGAERIYSLGRGFEPDDLAGFVRAGDFARDLRAWNRIRSSRRAADYFDFIEHHPGSALSELAQAAVERLERRRIATQRHRDEPVQHPGDNRFRPGDRYLMRLTRPGLDRTLEIRVLEVDEHTARYSNVYGQGQLGESTLAGGVVNDGIATYDPPYVLLPGGSYQVGHRWSGRSLRTDLRFNRREWMDYAARVEARETIEVPAGRFQTFRVSLRVRIEGRPELRATYWSDPDWGIGVASDFQYHDADDRVLQGRRVLLSRQRSA